MYKQGADFVAPSDMMDAAFAPLGSLGCQWIWTAQNYELQRQVCFRVYGPFRDLLDSAA